MPDPKDFFCYGEMIEIGRDSTSGKFCVPVSGIYSFGVLNDTLTVRMIGETKTFDYASKPLLEAEYNRLKIMANVN